MEWLFPRRSRGRSPDSKVDDPPRLSTGPAAALRCVNPRRLGSDLGVRSPEAGTRVCETPKPGPASGWDGNVGWVIPRDSVSRRTAAASNTRREPDRRQMGGEIDSGRLFLSEN
jgi:hypothetical protein